MGLSLLAALRLNLNPATPDVVAIVGGGGKSSVLQRLSVEIAAAGSRVIATTTTHLGIHQAPDGGPDVVIAQDGAIPWAAVEAMLAARGRCLLVGPIAQERRTGIPPTQVDELARCAADLGVGALVVEADGSRQRAVKAPAAHEPVLPATTTHVVAVVGVDAVGRALKPNSVHRPEVVRGLLGLPDNATPRLTPAMIARLVTHPAGGGKDMPPQAQLIPLINKVETVTDLAVARWVAQSWADQGYRGLIGAVGAAPRDSAARDPILERRGPWAVIILAAGRSSRMGQPKQLLAVDGELMVRRSLRTALAAGAPKAVLVTGAYGDAVTAAVADLVDASGGRVQLVENPAWADGQASSMQTGLDALAASYDAAIFMPVDQPFVPPSLLQQLVRAWQAGAPLAAPAVDSTVRGAPALFDRSLWPALRLVRGDMGGRLVLQANLAQAARIPAAAAWLRDLDTAADLA